LKVMPGALYFLAIGLSQSGQNSVESRLSIGLATSND
jgi:hypothetical protein